ncbi:uncharacterized protein E0L32_003742 [Thyridium curvatum]|uniref:Uncharacterized protein n=1 Tax=Thyridium curvatum TaxID=1093900 RepID=A0A507BIF9_9PEZI|nr:uncharacterized protein E0L32_003742 [Thyridium curvatum]TPX16448.1 hypothetical protein E0L32_003742 [Thyridium curvatum]
MIRERMGNCQTQHEKEIIRAHQAQVECLLVEVEKRNSRQAIICKKLAEIRNECLNLSKQLRAVYAGREELARSSTSQSLLDASTRKARTAAA